MNLDFMKDRPTLAQVNAKPRGFPKHALKLRVEDNGAADRADKRKLEVWRRKVFNRDKGICRCCGRKVERILELLPQRAESHHIVSRSEQAVRYDRRNGALLCGLCHGKVTTGKLVIVQVARFLFRLEGRTYINADKKLTFKEAA